MNQFLLMLNNSFNIRVIWKALLSLNVFTKINYLSSLSLSGTYLVLFLMGFRRIISDIF
jgi:hypothetical protein